MRSFKIVIDKVWLGFIQTCIRNSWTTGAEIGDANKVASLTTNIEHKIFIMILIDVFTTVAKMLM